MKIKISLMNLILFLLSLIMIFEHAYIGINALFKQKAVNKITGIPLALFEILYYILLVTFLNTLTLAYFFLFIHVVGGLYYIFGKERPYKKKLYTTYSIFEFSELFFIIYVLLLI